MADLAVVSKGAEILLLSSVARVVRLHGRRNDGATACMHPVALRVPSRACRTQALNAVAWRVPVRRFDFASCGLPT